MGNIDEFLENTKKALPHENVKKFLKIEKNVGNAVDLGCGMGRDTIFLIKNNWNVNAIDREDTKDFIESNLTVDEKKKLKYECQTFENIKLEKNDLVISNFSIPFCSKDYFDKFWKEIVDSINIGRLFCWKFFWNK